VNRPRWNARSFFRYPEYFYALALRRSTLNGVMARVSSRPLYVVRRGPRAVLACHGVGNDILPWGLR
jgi:hypothetical protein